MKTRANELLQRATNRQKAALGISAAVVGAGVLWFLSDGTTPSTPIQNADGETTRIVADLTRGARAERSWLDISEERMAAMEGRLKRLEAERRKLEQDNAELSQQNVDMADNANRAIDAQAQEIERLRGQIEAVQKNQEGQASFEAKAAPGVEPSLPAAAPRNPFEQVRNDLAPQIRRRTDLGSPTATGTTNNRGASSSTLIHFNLGAREGGSKPLDRYVPAGAYAPAEVIGGVDAAVGVNAQADPRPVLFRITGPAVTAALGGTKQTADLSGCTVTGAAFGDLSSEKVYVRLQTMTCARRPGEVFETAVQGYMAGAGKAGVRGQVVSREGALVAQSFLAGAIGGIGGAAAQSLQPDTLTTTTGVTTPAQPLQDIVKGGLGQGLDAAGSKVSDYLVKRAEQYQPVIVMQAGTKVELVFIAGVTLTPDAAIAPKSAQTKGTNG